MGTLFETALIVGGASRDRTGDLYNAIVALSQLSYGPVMCWLDTLDLIDFIARSSR